MRTGWVRYSAGVVLVAAAAGLLVSSGPADGQTLTAGGPVSGSPLRSQTGVTTCRFPALERVGGHVMAAGDCAGKLVLPGAAGPERATETYRAGRPGHALLASDARGCLAAPHRELRVATRSCPVGAVTMVP
jgi:hypothetical protein